MKSLSETIEGLIDRDDASRLVSAYFEPGGTFAGTTFATLGGGWEASPDAVTEADLLAVSLLDVTYPPRAVRRLLEAGEVRTRMSELLADIPTDMLLWGVEDLTLVQRAMDHLDALKGVGPVKAGKLLARKRPWLVPICDEAVVRTVGGEFREIWRESLRDALRGEGDVRSRIDSLAATVVPRPTTLRTLDVLFWMHGSNAKSVRAVWDGLGSTPQRARQWGGAHRTRRGVIGTATAARGRVPFRVSAGRPAFKHDTKPGLSIGPREEGAVRGRIRPAVRRGFSRSRSSWERDTIRP
jgi:hypothetical protein